MTPRQTAILLGIGLTWGASFLFIKVLVDDGVEPLGVSAARTTLGALVLFVLMVRKSRAIPRLRPRTWLGLAALGLLNFAIPWTLFGVAEQHVPSGAASIVNSMNPLWAALLAVAFLHGDTPRGLRAVGLAIGFGGVIVLLGKDVADIRSASTVAILLLVAATMCYAISTVAIRRWLGHVTPVTLAATQVGFAALMLMPSALATGAYANAHLDIRAWLSLAALGMLGSGVAVAGYMALIHEIGPVRASVVTYLLPPVGVALGWLVLGERVGWNLVGGLACVVAGVALVQGLPVGRWAGRLAGRQPGTAAAAPAD